VENLNEVPARWKGKDNVGYAQRELENDFSGKRNKEQVACLTAKTSL
jgi:hypothetical protein